MNIAAIKLGPVLSFRGVIPSGDGTCWQVTALIGVEQSQRHPAPAFFVDGAACQPPLLLLEHQGVRYFRYDVSVAIGTAERKVRYGFAEGGPNWHFTVPSIAIAPRMAYVSCNGFPDPASMRRLVRPAGAVWDDLLCNHDKSLRPDGYLIDREQIWHERRTHDRDLQRFHLLLMGGDQIYFDSVWEDLPELKQWVSLSRAQQLAFKVSDALRRQIADYYLGLYGQRWLAPRRGTWDSARATRDSADAMATIPTVMMWDDHDIFDGWGSYSPQMQQCALFKTLFDSARRAFWVFQLQHAVDSLPALEPAHLNTVSPDDPQFTPIAWRKALAGDALALPLLDRQPGFSYAFDIGPASLVVADLRTERSCHQVMGEDTWSALQVWFDHLPAGICAHLLFMSSVPVAHPKLSAIENGLDLFGQDHVLDSSADDLKDHWSHDDHEGERKRLIKILSCTAEAKALRVAIVSGDVHVAAWGTIYRTDAPPASNRCRLQQFTSSAVIHPSLCGVLEKLFLSFLNSAACRVQQIDVTHKVEMMLFPGHGARVLAARNWLALEVAEGTEGMKLWATWRCENHRGFSNHLQAVHPATPF